MASIDELLQKGINAAKAKQVAEARSILKQVVELEPRNETAWLWLSSVVETDEQRIVCLENVLAINPANKVAQKGLSVLRQKATTIKPLPEATERLSPPKTPSAAQSPVPSPSQAAKPKCKLSPTVIWLSVTIVLFVICNVLVILFVDNPFRSRGGPPAAPTSRPTPTATRQPTVTSTLISKIETANGNDWWAATETDRIELCKWMDANRRATMGNSVGWRFLFNGLNEFYQTDEPLVLQQRITETAAMLILMSE